MTAERKFEGIPIPTALLRSFERQALETAVHNHIAGWKGKGLTCDFKKGDDKIIHSILERTAVDVMPYLKPTPKLVEETARPYFDSFLKRADDGHPLTLKLAMQMSQVVGNRYSFPDSLNLNRLEADPKYFNINTPQEWQRFIRQVSRPQRLEINRALLLARRVKEYDTEELRYQNLGDIRQTEYNLLSVRNMGNQRAIFLIIGVG